VAALTKVCQERVMDRAVHVKMVGGAMITQISFIQRVPNVLGGSTQELCQALKDGLATSVAAKFAEHRVVSCSVDSVSMYEDACVDFSPVSCVLNLACGCLPLLCGGACIYAQSKIDRRWPQVYIQIKLSRRAASQVL
jgi:hypothetical protein